jgi:hypothetical protein
MNPGGEKFGPAESEATIRDLTGVVDVAMAEDEVPGERVGELIVGDPGLSVVTIKSLCQLRLARYEVPEINTRVAELPYDRVRKALA